MANSIINGSWQRMFLALSLCTVCLLCCVNTVSAFSVYEDEMEAPMKRELSDLLACPGCFPHEMAKRHFFVRKSSCACCSHSRGENKFCCERCRRK